jgi:hypothetical protein
VEKKIQDLSLGEKTLPADQPQKQGNKKAKKKGDKVEGAKPLEVNLRKFFFRNFVSKDRSSPLVLGASHKNV